ncbi:LemA family protein [Candidatus Gracilibacteria bacterium]|nr:LemA family protein [Candidatus Gracilibacteria bacterium]
MDLVNIFIIVGAVIFVLVLWGIVGFRHLKHLKLDSENQWEVLDEKIRKRQDLVPLLVESFRRHVSGQEQLVEQLIAQRAIASKESMPTANKIAYEHDISDTLEKLFEIAKVNPDILKDTVFLEVKSEMAGVFDSAKSEVKKYNEIIRRYNSHRDFLILKPISRSFKYGVLNIFDI